MKNKYYEIIIDGEKRYINSENVKPTRLAESSIRLIESSRAIRDTGISFTEVKLSLARFEITRLKNEIKELKSKLTKKEKFIEVTIDDKTYIVKKKAFMNLLKSGTCDLKE